MNLILLTDMSLLTTVISDIIVSIFTYPRLLYNIECVMSGIN